MVYKKIFCIFVHRNKQKRCLRKRPDSAFKIIRPIKKIWKTGLGAFLPSHLLNTYYIDNQALLA